MLVPQDYVFLPELHPKERRCPDARNFLASLLALARLDAESVRTKQVRNVIWTASPVIRPRSGHWPVILGNLMAADMAR